jgi:hypothetical protein
MHVLLRFQRALVDVCVALCSVPILQRSAHTLQQVMMQHLAISPEQGSLCIYSWCT